MIAEKDKDRVPDLLLEQYALGELSEPERARVEAALESDGALRGRLEDLRESDEAILAEAPVAEIAASIRRRMLAVSTGAKGRAKRPTPFFLSAAAALVVLAGAMMARNAFFPSVDDLSRPKGGSPGISIYKQSASGIEELSDGASAAAGDVLQIRYAAGSARYGAVYSLDGRGAITRHLPAESGAPGTRSPRLAEAGAILPSAYELDDAPGFERFFLVSSPSAFDLAVVSDALRDLATTGPAAVEGEPSLPPGFEWKSLLLRKNGGPR